MKTCTKCGEPKALTEFGKHKSTKDGLRHLCRECNNAAARKWGHDNPEKAAALAKKWATKNPGRREAITRKWLVENPERDKANKRKYYAANKEAFLVRTKKWAKENHGRVLKSAAASRDRNRAVINARSQRYRAKNLEIYQAREKSWRVRNKPKMRAADARRRATEIRATPIWLTAIQRAQIQEFYDIADARSMQTGVAHHVDHIHALQGKNFRGLHVPWNLQLLTAEENIRKGNRLPTTFE